LLKRLDSNVGEKKTFDLKDFEKCDCKAGRNNSVDYTDRRSSRVIKLIRGKNRKSLYTNLVMN